MADVARSQKIKAYSTVPPFFSQFRYNYRDRDSDIGSGGAKDWKSPRLPGAQGKSLSVKNSAKAGLPRLLASL